MTVQAHKQAQRQVLLKRRLAVSAEAHAVAEQRIVERLRQSALYQQAEQIGLYRAIGSEISVDALWQQAMRDGKQCYFPVCVSETELHFLPVDADTVFLPGACGVLEPQVTTSRPACTLSIVLVPLLGFDLTGNRLGRGGGYYDRWLATHEVTHCIGVGYALQELPQIAVEATDVSMDWVVTEQAMHDLSKRES